MSKSYTSEVTNFYKNGPQILAEYSCYIISNVLSDFSYRKSSNMTNSSFHLLCNMPFAFPVTHTFNLNSETYLNTVNASKYIVWVLANISCPWPLHLAPQVLLFLLRSAENEEITKSSPEVNQSSQWIRKSTAEHGNILLSMETRGSIRSLHCLAAEEVWTMCVSFCHTH